MSLPAVQRRQPSELETLLETFAPISLRCIQADGSGPTLQRIADDAAGFLAQCAAQREVLEAAMAPVPAEEVRDALAAFLLAWPGAAKADLAGYGAQLLSDVLAERPTRYALDTALGNLRRSSRFLPSIAEVLADLQQVQGRLRSLAYSISRIAEDIPRIREMADRRQRMEAAQRSRRGDGCFDEPEA